ncbi:MAG TPA: diacylglycerol kinase family protein [Planctomycetes bacterium]|nr:diacylglycerol kinase family protein [Fuerstiella sp.]HIK94649.1 diacylglycerol kinase family protein [Planctomycetota bacterium]
MRTENTSFIDRRFAAFRFAFAGIATLFRTQAHSWIHLVATVAVVVVALICAVDRLEWCLLIFSISLVWLAEAINTAVEFTVDLASPEFHETAGKAKDVAAGAVLIAAATAAIIGLIVLGPHLWRLVFP